MSLAGTLFRACPLSIGLNPQNVYDSTPDGSRFLAICLKPESNPTKATVWVDWTTGLR